MGADLNDVIIKNNGRRVGYFLMTGEDLPKLDQEYMSGRALVNPIQFRQTLNWLRDKLFEKLRTEGRYERDRSSKYRGYKKQY